MKGAIVFFVGFMLVLLVTLTYADMPPSKQIYAALNVASADYQVLGIPATTLVIVAFNGVIYGIIG